MAWALRQAAAALLLLLLAGAGSPVWAAEDDPYSVTVSVDATSDTIGKARDMARGDGQRRALATLAAAGSNAVTMRRTARHNGRLRPRSMLNDDPETLEWVRPMPRRIRPHERRSHSS